MADGLRHSCDNCDGIDPASCVFVPGGVDELRRGHAQRTVDAWSHYAKHWRERAEKAEAALATPDAAVYNLVWTAARNEHTRDWLASQGLVVMEQAAYDAGLADLRRLRGEADLRAEKAEAAVARVRRLCDLTIDASCRVQAIDQARDTLAALDREEA